MQPTALSNTPQPTYNSKMHSKRMPMGKKMGLVESAKQYIAKSKKY